MTSYGFADFDNGQGGGQRLLHARVAVSNGSPMPWEVDGRQQFLAAPGLQPQAPSFLNTNASSQGPVYPIPSGSATTFDYYFALPPGYAQPQSLGGFALDWSVNAGGQVVANQTTFDRIEGVPGSYDPYPPYVVVGLGFGYGWWYAPFYPYRRYPPVIRGYYYAPRGVYGGAWRGAPPGAPAARRGRATTGRPARGGAPRGTPPARRRRAPPQSRPDPPRQGEALLGEPQDPRADPRRRHRERPEHRDEARHDADRRILDLRRGLEHAGGEADGEGGADRRRRDEEDDPDRLADEVEEEGIHDVQGA